VYSDFPGSSPNPDVNLLEMRTPLPRISSVPVPVP